MRFYEGDYAYEIEQVRDNATQLFTGWRYNLYRIRPDQKIIRSGEASSQEEAASAAQKALHSIICAAEQPEKTTRSRAA